MRAAREKLANLTEWTKEGIAQTIEDVSSSFEINMGKLGQPIRVAVTGGSVSPPIDVTVWLVGRERALKRLDNAIIMIEERAAASEGSA
jgi:glutamyl-tRNA synthetase